jgi:hypothetical protein
MAGTSAPLCISLITISCPTDDTMIDSRHVIVPCLKGFWPDPEWVVVDNSSSTPFIWKLFLTRSRHVGNASCSPQLDSTISWTRWSTRLHVISKTPLFPVFNAIVLISQLAGSRVSQRTRRWKVPGKPFKFQSANGLWGKQNEFEPPITTVWPSSLNKIFVIFPSCLSSREPDSLTLQLGPDIRWKWGRMLAESSRMNQKNLTEKSTNICDSERVRVTCTSCCCLYKLYSWWIASSNSCMRPVRLAPVHALARPHSTDQPSRPISAHSDGPYRRKLPFCASIARRAYTHPKLPLSVASHPPCIKYYGFISWLKFPFSQFPLWLGENSSSPSLSCPQFHIPIV